nr:MAG TPA: hypothetical protein [Caudoviricetes sp.]
MPELKLYSTQRVSSVNAYAIAWAELIVWMGPAKA